jgi:hypothetical protein
MALSANSTSIEARSAAAVDAELVNAAELYAGAYVGMFTYTHGTGASQGRVTPFNDENFMQPVGFTGFRATGTASGGTKSPVQLTSQVRRVSVTGVSASAQNGRKVYATDDATFTLTRPTLGAPIGIVLQWVTGTTCDALFFSTAELALLALSGWGQEQRFIATVNGVESAGNHATGVECSNHGLILGVYGIVSEPMTDVDSTATFNLEIDTVDVTGGVITWATADLLGAKLAGTAITAANEFHEGSVIDVECAAGTAGTAADGYMNIYAEIEYLLGL